MIAIHATNLAATGHQVDILTNVINTKFPIGNDVSIKKNLLPTKLGTIFSALFSKFDADFVIADIISLALLLSFRNRHRTLYYAQDYDESYYQSLPARLIIRLLYFIGLRLFRLNTIAVADHLAEKFQKRFSSSPIVIENGVDKEVFYPDPDLSLLAQKTDRLAILVLSRHDTRKGFDLAVKVLNTISPSLSQKLEIWSVGEPPGNLFKGLQHRHLGYVDESRLRQIMSSCDLFFYPTRHEGFPLMVVEAFACRCPVLTTEAVTYARNRKNAFVGKIGDVDGLRLLLVEILQDKELLRSVIPQAAAFSSEYTLSKCIESFQNVLSTLKFNRT